MIFTNIPAGASVFVDANLLIYHFTSDPKYGPACSQLIKRVETQQVHGFTSAHVLADVAHRLMTLEAMILLGWSYAGIASRLRKHSSEIAKLSIYRHAIASIPVLGFQVLPVTYSLVEAATQLSQHQLLMGDALIVATMQANHLSHLASNTTDFDRVAGITRYAPT